MANEYLVASEDQAAIDTTVNAINNGLGESASDVDGRDVLALAHLLVSASYFYSINSLPGGGGLPIKFITGSTSVQFSAAIDISEGGDLPEAILSGVTTFFVESGAQKLAAAITAGASALGVSASPCVIAIGATALGYVATDYVMDVLTEGYDTVIGYDTTAGYNDLLDKVTITSKRSSLENILRHNWEGVEHSLNQKYRWEISTLKDGINSVIEFESPGKLTFTDAGYSDLHAYITDDERFAATIFILDNIGETFEVIL